MLANSIYICIELVIKFPEAWNDARMIQAYVKVVGAGPNWYVASTCRVLSPARSTTDFLAHRLTGRLIRRLGLCAAKLIWPRLTG
jgi:hypothetical protein